MPWTVARPSPVPLPSALVVKNGSKRCCMHVGRHAGAGVGHGEHDVGSRRSRRVHRRVVLVEIDIGRLDRQGAAARHGILRVDRQVEHDLFHLAAIGLDAPPGVAAGPSTILTSSLSRRPSMGRMSSRIAFRSSSVGSMICLRLNASSWRRQRRRARARFLNFRDVESVRGSSGPALVQQQLAEAENHRQQIVEVVRHAAGQASDGFHLLGLLKLRLEHVALGHVLGDADSAHRFAAARPRRMRPAPLSQRTFPSGRIVRCSTVKSDPVFIASPMTSSTDARSSG